MLFFTIQVNAQVTDSTTAALKRNTIWKTNLPVDTIQVPPAQRYHSPKKAALLSTALPGAGQIYNRKWWKVPVIYAGAGALTYSLQFNHSRYVKYRDAYKYRIDGDAGTVDAYVGIYSDDNLNTLQQYYHRYRDLTVIGFAALYALNIIDASVDAHLYNFDVSDDLSLRIQPALINTVSMDRYVTGFSMSIKF